MAIRLTVSFSGYVAQNLASAPAKSKTCRFFHDVFTRPRSYHNPDIDPGPGHRPTPSPASKRSVSTYATIAGEFLGVDCFSNSKPSPLVVGLISLVKSTATGGGCSGGGGVFGISLLKASSVIPFLNGSKWLPCNEINSSEVDKGATKMMNNDQSVTVESVKRCDVEGEESLVKEKEEMGF
ncbi:hypothetical protein QVD17_06998 [Tagetes erecta]|uniref:Uncharacterized protein n=1 Tax=Tagetes erecta TaxID=13708 RepID=A0AAD8LI03_TARER|nr:hypothetical protein QVD17_06998 [Tagetes erecta]